MYGGRGIHRGLQGAAHLLETDEAPDCAQRFTFTGLHMQTVTIMKWNYKHWNFDYGAIQPYVECSRVWY